MEIQCNYVHRGSLPRVGFIWYNASGDGQTLLTKPTAGNEGTLCDPLGQPNRACCQTQLERGKLSFYLDIMRKSRCCVGCLPNAPRLSGDIT